MSSHPVDLRSDTLTCPTESMRRAMASAEVGDDVFGEDPTVRRLEEHAAEWTGHQAALFVPTGTMGNQVAIQVQTTRGTDVILDRDCHVYRYELGAMAAWSGVLPRVVEGAGGPPSPDAVRAELAGSAYYLARSSLLVLENTHNHAGGLVTSPQRQDELLSVARSGGIRVHLDGARVFNAAAALDVPVRRLTAGMDSVMFCLSKGLGAPAGSLLCGCRELIDEGRVVRKRMGGGMRQVGVLAAAGLHALEHHVERLAEDHRRARQIANALAELDRFAIEPETVRTNIVIASLKGAETNSELLERLRAHGVLAIPMGAGRIRFVTHLGVDDSGVARAIEALRRCGAAA